MSYCVNCGVELDKGLKACPLCSVPVINPGEAHIESTSSYPNIPVEGVKSRQRDLILPVTLLLLIPVFITLLSDYLTSGRISWSIFVVSSLALVWIFLIPPFSMSKPRLLLCLTIDWISLLVFLYILSLVTGGEWLVPLALPVSLSLGVVVLGLATLFKYVDMRKLVRISISMFATAAFLIITELIIDMYFEQPGLPTWSSYAAIILTITAVVFLSINRNKRLKQDLKERLFY